MILLVFKCSTKVSEKSNMTKEGVSKVNSELCNFQSVSRVPSKSKGKAIS